MGGPVAVTAPPITPAQNPKGSASRPRRAHVVPTDSRGRRRRGYRPALRLSWLLATNRERYAHGHAQDRGHQEESNGPPVNGPALGQEQKEGIGGADQAHERNHEAGSNHEAE